MANAQKQITLGLDIGGTRIKGIALEDGQKILEEVKLPSQAHIGPRAVRNALGEAVAHFRLKQIAFSAIGIGCAGSVDHAQGVVRNSPNFADWKDVSLRDWIQEDFKVPVVVENDANCAAVGEWHFGNRSNWNNLVLLTLGTGVGGGLILNRRLFRGSTGTGGELGHFSIHAGGEPCPCGNSGCFERYCSASALIKKTDGISAKEIFARAADEPFRTLVQEFLSDFKIGLVSLANVFDPDVILIGGGMSSGVSHYLDELRDWLRTHAFPAVAAHVQLEMTKNQNLSGAIGAALLAADSSLT